MEGGNRHRACSRNKQWKDRFPNCWKYKIYFDRNDKNDADKIHLRDRKTKERQAGAAIIIKNDMETP